MREHGKKWVNLYHSPIISSQNNSCTSLSRISFRCAIKFEYTRGLHLITYQCFRTANLKNLYITKSVYKQLYSLHSKNISFIITIQTRMTFPPIVYVHRTDIYRGCLSLGYLRNVHAKLKL